jgi:hypothetical protein
MLVKYLSATWELSSAQHGSSMLHTPLDPQLLSCWAYAVPHGVSGML